MIPRVQIEIEIFMNYVSWPAMEDIEKILKLKYPSILLKLYNYGIRNQN